MINLKKLTSILLLFSTYGIIYAQDAVTASGSDASGGGGSSSYTYGQVLYTTNTGINGSTAQGVQQSNEFIGIEIAENAYRLTAFPNPTSDSFTLNIGNYNNEKLTYQLHDMKGDLLEGKYVVSNSTIIGLQHLNMSMYILSVFDNNLLIKTFKIVKF